MAGNGISGRSGDVLQGAGAGTQIAEVCKWSFNPKGNNPSYRSNRTAGYTKRAPGYKDGSGSVEGKWDPTNPITSQVDVTSQLILQLVTTTGQKMTVPAIVDAIKLDVDIEGAGIIGWTIDFSTDGAWSYATATSSLLGPLPTGSVPPSGAAPEEPAPDQGQPDQFPQGIATAAPRRAGQQAEWRTPHRRAEPQGQQTLSPEVLQAIAHAVATAMQTHLQQAA